jgi:hypothetical protein
MSRLDKTLEKKSKIKKYKSIMKVVFIFFLVINATICIFVVDINAKKMLGQEENILTSVCVSLENTIENFKKIRLLK